MYIKLISTFLKHLKNSAEQKPGLLYAVRQAQSYTKGRSYTMTTSLGRLRPNTLCFELIHRDIVFRLRLTDES